MLLLVGSAHIRVRPSVQFHTFLRNCRTRALPYLHNRFSTGEQTGLKKAEGAAVGVGGGVSRPKEQDGSYIVSLNDCYELTGAFQPFAASRPADSLSLFQLHTGLLQNVTSVWNNTKAAMLCSHVLLDV